MEMSSFCEDHHDEFKLYYSYLNDPRMVSLFIEYMNYIEHPRIVQWLKKRIQEHYKKIQETFQIVDKILEYYQQNASLRRSEMGKFLVFYSSEVKRMDRKSKKEILELFYKLIRYPGILSTLKELFYIFSDYRACLYYMTPSIDFYNTDKKTMTQVVHAFRDNLNTMIQIISRVYLGDVNPWGSPYYASAFAMYETLHILQLYYRNPFQECGMDVHYKCRFENKKKTMTYIQQQIKKYDIVSHVSFNCSTALIALKKKGYDLWFVISFLFECIYSEYTFEKMPLAIVWDCSKRVSQQRNNNMMGAMAYILTSEGYISNVNLLKRFND